MVIVNIRQGMPRMVISRLMPGIERLELERSVLSLRWK